jgi:hypothetical protein
MTTLQSCHGQSGRPCGRIASRDEAAADEDIPSEEAPREPEISAEDYEPPGTAALVGKLK